jgi:hypothetical protein
MARAAHANVILRVIDSSFCRGVMARAGPRAGSFQKTQNFFGFMTKV